MVRLPLLKITDNQYNDNKSGHCTTLAISENAYYSLASKKYNELKLTEKEIEAQYAKIAEDGGMTVEEVKNHYSDPRSKEWLIEDTKEQKLYEELYKEVKVSKGDKVSFADLFAAK